MIPARNTLTGAFLVLLSLSFMLPVLHAQEKANPDVYKSWDKSLVRSAESPAMTPEFIPGALLSQTVDTPSEPSVFLSSETASVTDASGGAVTETTLESPNPDSQVWRTYKHEVRLG